MSVLGLAAVAFYGALVPWWCLERYRAVRGEGDLIESTPTTRIADLAAEGPVEIKGRVVCEKPLVAPLSGAKCAFYRIVRTSHFVRDRAKPLWGGRKVSYLGHEQRPEQHWVDFSVKDATGTVRIDPAGAEVECLARGSKTEVFARDPRSPAGTLGVELNPVDLVADQTTIEIVPDAAHVYVLGFARRTPDGFEIGADPGGSAPYLVSVRTEKEVLGSRRFWAGVYLAGAVGSAVVGLAFAILSS